MPPFKTKPPKRGSRPFQTRARPSNRSQNQDQEPRRRRPRVQDAPDDSLNAIVDTLVVDEPLTLLEFLKSKLRSHSVSSIKRLLKYGCIGVDASEIRSPAETENLDRERRANGKWQIISQFDYRLTRGDKVFVLSARANRYGFHHDLLRLLYEDNDIVVVDKSSGLHSVDSTHRGIENAASIVEAYMKKKNPDKRVYVVHRLDRDTSGVMIFAKTREAQNRLVKSWNDVVEKREYTAIVLGHMPAKSGTIDAYLYEDAHKIVHATDDPSRGARAVTHYRVVEENAEFSRIVCELETGRTNQIRVHVASLGHPIVGDLKYGATRDDLHRLGLHARNIAFKHPISHQLMRFEVTEPPEFANLFKKP